MSRLRNLSPDEQARLRQAATWQQRLASDPTLAQSAGYIAWSADPRNLGALKAVQEACSAVESLGSTPEMLELRRQARARSRERGAARWGVVKVAGLAALAILAIAQVGLDTLLPGWRAPAPADYETGIGRHRVITLSDGSRIWMDSATRLHVSYNETVRAITLDRGRSRFDVAHDPTHRPFTVTAGPETVVAVGTSFNVEHMQSTVLVTLIEGQVLIQSTPPVSSGTNLPSSLALKAGQQLVVSRNGRPTIVPADLQAAMAWESGHLVFRDETLATVVARVNRYTAHPVRIDPSLASLRISGVFNAGDVRSFVSAVTSYLPVRASMTPSDDILLQPRP